MDVCKVAAILLLSALVFYLVISLCCGKNPASSKEGFCGGGGATVVRNNRSGYYPAVGRSIAGQVDCGSGVADPRNSPSYLKQYGCPNYVIEGMDSPEKVASFIANKALQNQLKYMNPCTNPDNHYPAGNPMAIARGGSCDGRLAMTGAQLQQYADNVERDFGCNGDEDSGVGVENFYEAFDENEKESFGLQNQDLTAPVAPCTTDTCGLPETMFNDKCGDPNTYVYDRQISVNAKSRTYGLGNYLLGDLPICPAVFKDQYGHNIFTPAARPSADLNAGSLRFIGPTEVNLTNLNGDVQAYRQCGAPSNNVSVQYSLAG